MYLNQKSRKSDTCVLQNYLANFNKSLGDKGYSQMCSFTGVLLKRPLSTWSSRALDSDRRSGKRANKQRLPTYKLHVMDDIKVLQHVKAWTLSWKISVATTRLTLVEERMGGMVLAGIQYTSPVPSSGEGSRERVSRHTAALDPLDSPTPLWLLP